MAKKNVDSILPLSPTQTAFLFHRIRAKGADEGFLQVRVNLEGRVEGASIRRAWSTMLDRHQVLRTSIHWEDLDRPLQVVHSKVETPFDSEDWSDIPDEDRRQRVEDLLSDDRNRGLKLTEAPVSRLKHVLLGADNHLLIWSCHHILLDGWSTSIVLDEMVQALNSLAAGRSPQFDSPARSFTKYLKWLSRQDMTESKSFWTRQLSGFDSPTPIPLSESGANNVDSSVRRAESFVLTTEETEALRGVARAHKTTLNNVIEALWAVVLGRIAGTSDVVFGVTASGRNVALDGAMSVVGLLANVVPIRARFKPDDRFTDWISSYSNQRSLIRSFEHTPLTDIQQWSDVPAGQPLFKSLIVFENFPQTEGRSRERLVEIREFRSGLVSTYPLTLGVRPGERLSFDIIFERGLIDAEFVSDLGEALISALKNISRDADQKVDRLFPSLEQVEPETPGSDRNRKRRTIELATSEIESRLLTIWQEAFGTREIGIGDDFFNLGGNSLLAVRLFAEIESEFGKALPLASLIEYPTVRQQAELLAGEQRSPQWTSLVPLSPGGDGIPLLCIHAGGGEVLIYRDLAARLGRDRPVYGLQALGLDGATSPLTTVKEMAEHYLEEVRTAQPSGPYAFLTLCFGNLVALEMAQLIRQIGEDVTLIGILDSAPYVDELWKQTEPRSTAGANFARRVELHGLPRAAMFAIDARVRRIRTRLQQEWIERFASPRTRYLKNVEAAIANAESSYRPRPFADRMVLLRSEETAQRKDKEFHIATWDFLTHGAFETHVLPINHTTMFEPPDVDLVAEVFSKCLSEAEIKV